MLLRPADEVGGEQVVVAGHRIVLGPGERRLDPRRLLVGRARRRPGSSPPRSPRGLGVGLDDPERVEGRRQRLAEVVDRAQRARATSVSVAGSRRSSGSIPSPSTNTVTIACGSSSVAATGGRDPDPPPRARSRSARRPRSISSRDVSLPGNPDHVVGAAEPCAEVAVGDPAVERLTLALGPVQDRGELLDDPAQLAGLT